MESIEQLIGTPQIPEIEPEEALCLAVAQCFDVISHVIKKLEYWEYGIPNDPTLRNIREELPRIWDEVRGALAELTALSNCEHGSQINVGSVTYTSAIELTQRSIDHLFGLTHRALAALSQSGLEPSIVWILVRHLVEILMIQEKLRDFSAYYSDADNASLQADAEAVAV